MKTNKNDIETKRRILDQKLKGWQPLQKDKTPPSGWIKAIRNALGISSRQLAQALGVDMSAVIQLEQRESKKKVTLETLERVADKMECKLVYAIVPKEDYQSLEAIIDKKAKTLAEEILDKVEHSMRLELQGGKSTEQEIQKLKNELKMSADPRIWGLVKNKIKKGKKDLK